MEIDPNIKRGMNPKKQHEVSKMAALVHDLVKDTGSDVIVDVGSGLVGYLFISRIELFRKDIFKRRLYCPLVICCKGHFCQSSLLSTFM